MDQTDQSEAKADSPSPIPPEHMSFTPVASKQTPTLNKRQLLPNYFQVSSRPEHSHTKNPEPIPMPGPKHRGKIVVHNIFVNPDLR